MGQLGRKDGVLACLSMTLTCPKLSLAPLARAPIPLQHDEVEHIISGSSPTNKGGIQASPIPIWPVHRDDARHNYADVGLCGVS